MKSALSFLLAARSCEIRELERLAGTSELVGSIGRFIHALQRERGTSNIFLASRGERFAAMRLEQIPQCDALQEEVTASFDALGGGARLLNRIAMVLDALSSLPGLRMQIAARTITSHEATSAFTRLIAALLALVFEAADAAGDPAISKSLVAMLHFMQGKEFAGQERAHGAAVFARGRIDAREQQQWRHLIEQQHHCFDVFREFATREVLAAAAATEDHGTVVQVERLRRIGQSLGAMPADESLVDAWYESCTARLDAMRRVEDLLASHLKDLCGRKVAQAREALRDQEALLQQLHHDAARADAPALIGPQLERSVIDLLNEQTKRLQAMGDELDSVRSALNERKLIERAKGLLMAHRRVSEDEAYRALRQMAMNQKRRVAEVAETVLAMAEVLPSGPA